MNELLVSSDKLTSKSAGHFTRVFGSDMARGPPVGPN
jgi:hypothetical protein